MTNEANTTTNTASVTEYLELAKANDREGANAYMEKHFGALGTEEHNEQGLADFTKEALDRVEKEARAAATETKVEEGTESNEVQATDTDSESTN